MKSRLIYILIALTSLLFILLMQKQFQNLLSRAAPKTANIIIDIKNTKGPISQSWSAFSQGGEEPPPMLSNVSSIISNISPRYIRLDHIYDYYGIVKKTERGYQFDFSELDKTVDDILTSGALPFFSLSYMPPAFTQTGSVIDLPDDWNNWKNLVKATIEHYSGKNNRNLTNVYYEVWNEPDLPQFGGWKMGGNKDYRLLYYHTVKGAEEATNVNRFHIGGPAVGSYYSAWVTEFVSYIQQNNLRLDFYSWHRYHKNPEIYLSDIKNIRNLLVKFPQYANLPLIISEWGIDSENTILNNSDAAAAYSVYSIAKFYRELELAFNFEVKDGPPPNGGKWGLLTHEKDAKPLSPKPKFKAYKELSKLNGDLLELSGDGTFVSGLATKSKQNINVVLSNFDLSGKNSENVPVTFTGLSPSSYILKYLYPLTGITGQEEIISTNGSLSKNYIMPPNSIISIELTLSGPLISYIPGISGKNGDQALVLNNPETLLQFSSPEFHLKSTGSINFALKSFWTDKEKGSLLIFEAPFSTISGQISKLFLSKENLSSGTFITFGVSVKENKYSISLPISNWGKDSWHQLSMGWDVNNLWLSIDGKDINGNFDLDIRNGKTITFYPLTAAIDNLKIDIGSSQKFTRNFDGRIDQ